MDRRTRIDIVLGGPASSYEKLAARGRLRPFEAGGPSWRAIRREGSMTLLLDASPGRWTDEYARLVLSGDSPERVEGVGLVAGSTRTEEARAFLQVIAATDPTRGSMLLDDLLDAALVDSRDELRAARDALAKRGEAPRAKALLTEAPPWPPASIQRMLAKPDGAALVRVLAEQVAPDPLARASLLASFEGPPRVIDGAVLDELTRAAGGRLAREPRFRSWLRSEWTAWARQRYRRVARNLAATKGQAP